MLLRLDGVYYCQEEESDPCSALEWGKDEKVERKLKEKMSEE